MDRWEGVGVNSNSNFNFIVNFYAIFEIEFFIIATPHMDEYVNVFKQAAAELNRIVDPTSATASHHIAQQANTTSQRANTQYDGFSIRNSNGEWKWKNNFRLFPFFLMEWIVRVRASGFVRGFGCCIAL